MSEAEVYEGVILLFDCSHEFMNRDLNKATTDARIKRLELSGPCPDCTEREEQQHHQNGEALRILTEQAEGIRLHIEEAREAKVEAVVQELGKMLETCNRLLATKAPHVILGKVRSRKVLSCSRDFAERVVELRAQMKSLEDVGRWTADARFCDLQVGGRVADLRKRLDEAAEWYDTDVEDALRGLEQVILKLEKDLLSVVQEILEQTTGPRAAE